MEYDGPSSINPVIDLIRNVTLKSWPKCSNLIEVVDSSQINLSPDLLSPTSTNLHLIIPILLALNESSISSVYNFRLCRPCSLVLIEINIVDTDENALYWPEMRFPGSPFQAYHIFLVEAWNNHVNESQLLNFARTARKTHLAIFAVHTHESLNIYTLGLQADHLVLTGIFSAGNSQNWTHSSGLISTLNRVNYEGAPVVVNMCPACGKGIEYFRRTGTWNSLVEGIVYELVHHVNGTYREKKVMTLTRTGPDKDGKWDEWIQPLVDGVAAISTIQRYRAEGSRVVMYTRPAFYDNVCFLTEKPKRVVKSPVFKLLSPLNPYIWMSSCVSLFMVFTFIEISIHSHRKMQLQRLPPHSGDKRDVVKSKLPPHFHFFTLSAILKPVLEQGGMAENFGNNVRNDPQSRLLMALWLILLTVLIGGYKSAMTSVLVRPSYTNPPSTFKELAYSDYKIFAVFWTDNLQLDFQSLNNEIGKRLIDRAVEYNYYDPDCYVKIFEGDHACIGYDVGFRFLATVHLIDSYGRPRYVVSKESMFPRSTTFAVSQVFWQLYRFFDSIEPLNNLTRLLEASGVLARWADNRNRYLDSLGRHKAQETVKNGQNDASDKDSEQDSIFNLLFQINVAGLGVSICVFVIELALKKLGSVRSGDAF